MPVIYVSNPPTQAQVEACIPDAIRLCQNVPFNLEAIRACLDKSKSVSTACKKALKE